MNGSAATGSFFVSGQHWQGATSSHNSPAKGGGGEHQSGDLSAVVDSITRLEHELHLLRARLDTVRFDLFTVKFQEFHRRFMDVATSRLECNVISQGERDAHVHLRPEQFHWRVVEPRFGWAVTKLENALRDYGGLQNFQELLRWFERKRLEQDANFLWGHLQSNDLGRAGGDPIAASLPNNEEEIIFFKAALSLLDIWLRHVPASANAAVGVDNPSPNRPATSGRSPNNTVNPTHATRSALTPVIASGLNPGPGLGLGGDVGGNYGRTHVTEPTGGSSGLGGTGADGTGIAAVAAVADLLGHQTGAGLRPLPPPWLPTTASHHLQPSRDELGAPHVSRLGNGAMESPQHPPRFGDESGWVSGRMSHGSLLRPYDVSAGADDAGMYSNLQDFIASATVAGRMGATHQDSFREVAAAAAAAAVAATGPHSTLSSNAIPPGNYHSNVPRFAAQTFRLGDSRTLTTDTLQSSPDAAPSGSTDLAESRSLTRFRTPPMVRDFPRSPAPLIYASHGSVKFMPPVSWSYTATAQGAKDSRAPIAPPALPSGLEASGTMLTSLVGQTIAEGSPPVPPDSNILQATAIPRAAASVAEGNQASGHGGSSISWVHPVLPLAPGNKQRGDSGSRDCGNRARRRNNRPGNNGRQIHPPAGTMVGGSDDKRSDVNEHHGPVGASEIRTRPAAAFFSELRGLPGSRTETGSTD